MGVLSSKIDVKLEAVRAFWGREECRSITFANDTASDQAGQEFDLNAITDEDGTEVKYLVWLDNGIVSAPTPAADQTLVAVTYSPGDTAAVIAGLFKTAVDALSNFKTVSVTNGKAIVENKYIGKVTEEDQVLAPDLTFAQLILGIGGDLGATAQGGSSLSIDTQAFEIKSDQTGENLLGDIFTGFNASIEMPLIEVTKERLRTIIGGVVGDTHTPSGGTELIGIGESKLYKNAIDYSGKLIMHPIRVDIADKSEDIIIWKCAPMPQDLNYSGTDQQVLNCTFKAYLDQNVISSINLLAFGDHTQDL